MSWLKRLFGQEKPQDTQAAIRGATSMGQNRSTTAERSVPPERLGLQGEYDESGLAKRVALAFDEHPEIDDIDTVYVAQTSSTVVLKGRAPNQSILNKMASVARSVNGAEDVDTSQVDIG